MGLLGLQNGCRTKKVCTLQTQLFYFVLHFHLYILFHFPLFLEKSLELCFCLGWGAVALRLYWETLTEGGAGCGESSELKRRRQVENTELMHVSIVCKLDIACAAQMLNAGELKKQSSVYQPSNWKWCNLCKFQCFQSFCGVARIFPNSLLRASGVGMTKLYIRNTQDEAVRSTMTLSRSPSLDDTYCASCLSLTFGMMDERVKSVSCMRMRPDTRQGPPLTWYMQ